MKHVRTAAVALASAEVWVVALVVGASVAITRLLPVALLVAGGFWIVRIIAWGRPSVRTPLDWLLACFVALLPMTLYITSDSAETRSQVMRLLTGIALYYAIVNWANSPSRLRFLFYGAIAVGIVSAIATPLIVSGTRTKLPFIPSILYATPSLVAETINFNVMAGLLVVLLPVPLAFLMFGGPSLRPWQRMVAWLATGLLALVLFWTQSRGAWIAAVVMGLLFIALRWRRGWIATAGTAVATLLVLRIPGVATLLNPFSVEGSVSGISDRVQIWQRALGMVQDFPFTGTGMGAFPQVADALYPFFVVPSPIVHAHNIYLQIAIDIGIPGLLVWLAIVFIIGRSAWQVRRRGRRTNQPDATVYGIAMIGCLTTLLVHGLTDAVMWGLVRPSVVVWGVWGLTIAAYRIYAEVRIQSTDPSVHV